MKFACRLFAVIVLTLSGWWLTPGTVSAQALANDARPVLRVVYFVPTDRKPEPDYVARLDRVLTEVQRFYREGMQQNGYGAITFELDRNADKTLRIHTVLGQEPMRAYGRNASDKVRREVHAVLAKEGLDIDRETVIIFQLLLEWQGTKAVEIGPYVGGGNAHSGTAWVYDDAKLDELLLPSKKPGGYYNGPCSLGQFNTHYIGGVAHELGHGLGLPHERERPSEQPRRGNSLMGAGNHTYGEELRGEGAGAFLTAAAALPLSLHPLFTGSRKPATSLTCRLIELTATPDRGKLTLTGKLQGGPPAVGIVVYNDPQDIPGDYDASGWDSPVNAAGEFRLTIEDLRSADYELRLRPYGASGDAQQFAYYYSVDRDLRPDVGPLHVSPLLQDALAAYRNRDQKLLTEIAARAKSQSPANLALARKLEHLQALLSPAKPKAAASLSAEVKAVKVANLEMEAMSVGWGTPLRNQVLSEGDASILLEVGGVFFDSGLYAHSPARHALRLDRKWKTLSTKYGLQDGHSGSVVFMVKGDGKELFRSQTIRDRKVHEKSIDVTSIALLELVVEDADDGGNSDWGVWLAPELQR